MLAKFLPTSFRLRAGSPASRWGLALKVLAVCLTAAVVPCATASVVTSLLPQRGVESTLSAALWVSGDLARLGLFLPAVTFWFWLLALYTGDSIWTYPLVEGFVVILNLLRGLGSFAPLMPGAQNLLPAVSGNDVGVGLSLDLDFTSSTDFEDLLVFTLDALELLWQDVNMVIELCGENALGLGFLGALFSLKRVFSSKRFKR